MVNGLWLDCGKDCTSHGQNIVYVLIKGDGRTQYPPLLGVYAPNLLKNQIHSLFQHIVHDGGMIAYPIHGILNPNLIFFS